MRGKHATASEARKVREDAQAEALAGRRQIIKLSAEVERLTQTLTSERKAHAESARKAAAMLDEQVSPTLEATQNRLTEALALVHQYEQAHRVINNAFWRVCDAFQDSLESSGMRPMDAHELKLKTAKYLPSHMNEEVAGFIRVSDLVATGGTSYVGMRTKVLYDDSDAEEILRVHRLQRAKGLRR